MNRNLLFLLFDLNVRLGIAGIAGIAGLAGLAGKQGWVYFNKVFASLIVADFCSV